MLDHLETMHLIQQAQNGDEHAKELLSGGYSIEETANITGFSDRYYFSKMFKKHMEVSPGEYQENLK